MSNTRATVPHHSLRISGEQSTGWSVVDSPDTNARELIFTFSAQDDGNGNFLLVCTSLDGEYFTDTWHETLEEVYSCAQAEYGIEQTQWVVL
jgi:hypothetical protein